MTSPEGFATIGWRNPKRRIDAATCGTAGSFSRGFAGEQNNRSIATHSMLSFAVSKSMGVPPGTASS
jgi:hypothetical protein